MCYDDDDDDEGHDAVVQYDNGSASPTPIPMSTSAPQYQYPATSPLENGPARQKCDLGSFIRRDASDAPLKLTQLAQPLGGQLSRVKVTASVHDQGWVCLLFFGSNPSFSVMHRMKILLSMLQY